MMKDNKQLTDGRDDTIVDSKDNGEVEIVHSHFPTLTHKQILAAIKAAGPLRKRVYAHIRKKHGLM